MEVSIVTKTGYEDGTLTAQIDMLGDGSSCAPGEAYHPLGLAARPNDPDTDPVTGDVTNGCRVIYVTQGSTLHTILLDDPRATQKLPEMEKGEALFYSPNQPATAYAHYKADGSLDVKATAGTKVTVQVGSGCLVEVSDIVVKIGGQDARALVHALEMQTIIFALLLEIASDATLLTTPPTSVVFAAYAPAKAALLTAVQTAISAQMATLATLQAFGT